jgi:hypothetical protein
VTHPTKDPDASLGMGVGLWRLSIDLMVVPLPWLSMLPVGEDCPELLTVLRAALGPTRSLLVMLS